MTERDWLKARGLDEMLDFLQGKASDRKMRLFAVGCCRQVWRWILDVTCLRAVETSEAFAEGLATSKQLRAAARRAEQSVEMLAADAHASAKMSKWARRDACRAALAVAATRLDADVVAREARSAVSFTSQAPLDQCGLLREVCGNPFRPVAMKPDWLIRNVCDLAAAIYDERAFDRMPILADALMDAGCDSAEVLDHCRSEGPHVRGCWVVDLILGKS